MILCVPQQQKVQLTASYPEFFFFISKGFNTNTSYPEFQTLVLSYYLSLCEYLIQGYTIGG